MTRRLELEGQQYGRLLVVAFADRDRNYQSIWRCVCDCGNEINVLGNSLRRGNTQSCGCLMRETSVVVNTTHGHAIGGITSRTYHSWAHMLQRCENPKDACYKNYGARGIKVCERWHRFKNFLEDMGECPEGLTLDRINNNGDYEPGNCRWATLREQANNKRNNRVVTYKGITRNAVQWAEDAGISPNLFRQRVDRDGWSVERALSQTSII